MILKDCPLCGKTPDLDDEDTLYPSGIYWRDTKNYGRHYGSRNDLDYIVDGTCYIMHCPISSGGCGMEISGDSKQEAIDAWNRRPTDKTITIGNMTNNILIPVIRKAIPQLLAQELCDVQPIDLPDEEPTTTTQIKVHVCDDKCHEFNHVHSFGQGWSYEPKCPLERGESNVVLKQTIESSNIFIRTTRVLDGIHLACEIPNLSFYR